MYHPSVDDERTTIRRTVEVQLAAVRAAAYGLSDEQLRARPLASALSIAGIIKHCSYVLAGRLVQLEQPVAHPPRYEDFYASFALTEEESFEQVLARYDELAAGYLSALEKVDPGAEVEVGPAPWYGRDEPARAALRYLLLQDIAELARHAGHADLIREQIDGALAAGLLAAVEQLPPNPFVTPWRPDLSR